MAKQLVTNVYLVAILATLLSCAGNNCRPEQLFGDESQSFIATYPKVDNRHDLLYYDKNQVGELDTLENGYKDFQLRIWIFNPAYPRALGKEVRQLIVVKKDAAWDAQNILQTWELSEDSA